MSRADVDSGLVVLAPLRIEARVLRRALPEITVLHTGMGAARAKRYAEKLGDQPASAFAVAGVCGALSPEIRPGDLVVASELRAADEAVRPCAGAETLVDALRDLGMTVHLGPLLSSSRLVRGEERGRLAEDGGLAVDMESAWLAAGVGARPCAVLRAVVDAPGYELASPRLMLRGLKALRALRSAAPVLALWAESQENKHPEEERWASRSGS